jgi:hypothetical protein
VAPGGKQNSPFRCRIGSCAGAVLGLGGRIGRGQGSSFSFSLEILELLATGDNEKWKLLCDVEIGYLKIVVEIFLKEDYKGYDIFSRDVF